MDNRSYRRPDVAGRNAATPSGSKRMTSQARTPLPKRGETYSAPRTAPSRRSEGDFSARPTRTRSGAGEADAHSGRSRFDGSESRFRSRFGESEPAPQVKRVGNNFARPKRRRRKLDPTTVVVAAVVAVALLAGLIYVGSSWFIATINNSTYCDNITVNGISISPYAKEEGKQYVREQIDERLNAQHTLSWQGSSWSFSAADFGGSIETDNVMERAWNIGHVGNIFDRSASIRSLKRNPINLTAPIDYDAESVDRFVDGIYNQLYIAPRNAEVAADLNNPVLAVEASAGQELDRETCRAQILNLLETGEGGEVLPVLTLEPTVSTEEAMESLELIVDYRTDTTARGYNGRFNVRKGLSYFYGMIVQPGEEVSFNEVVGPRTEERGWQLGTEYIGGGKSQEGYGGGICQASTTLYGALLKAGMTIMERSPHSMTVAYVEPSLDAAVTETGSKDLRFRNDTANPITIYTEVTKEYAAVRIYGVRPQYRYELESNVVRQDTGAVKVAYINDTDGEHCYYKDETVLYREGHAALDSEGWLVAYDWDTGEEVERIQLSFDPYESGYDIYWRGTHSRDEAGASKTASPTRAPDVAAKFD